jgi:two-component system, OmpR family, sensor kinase
MSSSLRADELRPAKLELGERAEPVASLPAPAKRPRWASPRSWTLRSKLVASTVLLFTALTLVTGVASVFALNRYLTGQVDQQLDSYFARPSSDDGGPGAPPSPNRGRLPGVEGMLVMINDEGVVTFNTATTLTNGRATLTNEQLSQLNTGLGRQPTTISLGDSLGDYRVVAGRSLQTNSTVIVGLPLASNQRTVVQMAWLVGIASVGGILLVALGGTWLVRRNLRPLDRVAATATRVSHLPLSEGKVDIAERVPAEDTDTNTEVGQVGAAFNEMLDHIDNALNARQKSEERVRQFVADASHELRTPLASIRGYAELTRREQEPVPPRVTHAIGRVESEAVRMTALVDDLLLLARLDAGRPLDHETVDLTEMVVNAVSDAHAAAPDHVWQLELPDEPVVIQGDPARLHQIVANLLGNARTHTAPGTVVRTYVVQEPHLVKLMVRDNGPGVPEELQSDVFQRFARGDTSRNRAAGSTGLGLSIVAAVAQAHGGSVSLDSVPGDTTFTVVLPA